MSVIHQSPILCWLVVWNINFTFPYIGKIIIPIDYIFFRGVAEPPTRYVCMFFWWCWTHSEVLTGPAWMPGPSLTPHQAQQDHGGRWQHSLCCSGALMSSLGMAQLLHQMWVHIQSHRVLLFFFFSRILRYYRSIGSLDIGDTYWQQFSSDSFPSQQPILTSRVDPWWGFRRTTFLMFSSSWNIMDV